MIWIFRDAKTRRPNGTATVTYEDVSVARTAVAMFNGNVKLLTISYFLQVN